MKNTWIIARRDFRSYFTSPIAYIIIAGFMGIMGWMFFFNLDHFGDFRLSLLGFFHHFLLNGFDHPVDGRFHFGFGQMEVGKLLGKAAVKGLIFEDLAVLPPENAGNQKVDDYKAKSAHNTVEKINRIQTGNPFEIFKRRL